jgi:predicted HicB family RNase H-like nuclease
MHNGCMRKQLSTTSITIRVPAEIAELLRTLAKQHDCSLNGEIVRALREYAEKHRVEQK